ncbi:MAG: hypothetical protein WC822_03435 [Candidatus Paceibacterota bacterium]|jgi:hypothetical protein
MNAIIPKDTRYVPFTQQKACCVPTSINIVMYKLGIHLVPQELLGYQLGLIVSKKDKNLFWNARMGKEPKTGYGTQMLEKQYEINLVFKKLKIPLKVINHPINNFKTKKEIISYISDCVQKDKNVVVLLRSGILNNSDSTNGHACVIDRIYPSRDVIRLIDPSANQPKWREFKIDKFIKAVRLHPTGEGRFLELEKIY